MSVEWIPTDLTQTITFNTGDTIILNVKTRSAPTVWERLLWPEPWEPVFDQTIILGA